MRSDRPPSRSHRDLSGRTIGYRLSRADKYHVDKLSAPLSQIRISRIPTNSSGPNCEFPMSIFNFFFLITLDYKKKKKLKFLFSTDEEYCCRYGRNTFGWYIDLKCPARCPLVVILKTQFSLHILVASLKFQNSIFVQFFTRTYTADLPETLSNEYNI